jgi:hypothetical protein
MPGVPSVTVLLDVPITFEVADGQRTHAPMVMAVVGGESTRLILDTGSTDHILTVELAERVGLAAEPGEAGTDSTGASVPSWSLGEVPIQIHGHNFTLGNVVAISSPAAFEGWGIGGFVSPQHLHRTAWVVLDMADDHLLLVDGDRADVSVWLAARAPALQLLTLDRVSGEPTILVNASVAPYPEMVTMLDTGGKRTEAAVAVVPGLAGGARLSTGRGVGGGEAFGSEVEGQTLQAGGGSLPIARLVLRDEVEGRGGLVGMDTLRGTLLAVNRDMAQPVYWLIPASLSPGADRSG